MQKGKICRRLQNQNRRLYLTPSELEQCEVSREMAYLGVKAGVKWLLLTFQVTPGKLPEYPSVKCWLHSKGTPLRLCLQIQSCWQLPAETPSALKRFSFLHCHRSSPTLHQTQFSSIRGHLAQRPSSPLSLKAPTLFFSPEAPHLYPCKTALAQPAR